ncbi:Major facilitator superfamily domain general substrate transporter [Penicillium lagena]|uniref:Major facilitator superfamily domain general substrate transporter n=1 Tax=Penicillium lagena TaxID=94218 RepID=UPI00253F7D45|nr:Major facilitator superfamily domain general substrate transporter [Penicillium lagena]KAJ5618838.1 Major facilitator superfamily domain general substrate transporter [Penicillium lagena]
MGEIEVEESATPAVEKSKAQQGYDDAADMLGGDLVLEYSQHEASVVRWKLDMTLVPMMFVSYLLSFIDKAILSTAAVYGMETDLNLQGQQYSWTNSIFYFGFLVWQYPNSIFMQRLPLGRWIGSMVFFWGLSVTASAGSTNFATLATSRFFLGIFEASNNPVFTLLVTQYYTRKEHALRACLWWAGGPVAAFIGDGVANGVGHLNGSLGQWQYLFLIFGPITMLWGIFLFFVMPSSPMTAWFLTPRERKIAVMRVLQNHVGLHNRQYKLYQVKECFCDPQVWMLFAIVFLQCIPGGGLTAFNKIILTGLGYSSVESTVVAMPEHAIQLVSILLAGVICSYFGRGRCIAMILSNICVLVGSVLLYTLPTERKLSRLGAVYSLLTCTVSYIMCMSMISSNIAGFTKKMTVSVFIFIGYCIGQIITPQFFISSEAPTYPTGFRAYFVTSAMMIAVQAALMIYLMNENHRRDKRSTGATVADDGDQHCISESDLMDLTDREQPNFRYTW